MANATERITILMSPSEKKRLFSKAQNAGISISEYLRRATVCYHHFKDEQVLCSMIDQKILATDRAERSIDDALRYVAESNRRIAQLENSTSIAAAK
ncbi:MAG: hypothetical protein AB2563_11480 [Candidatus Thiodiazotropha endolucinida]